MPADNDLLPEALVDGPDVPIVLPPEDLSAIPAHSGGEVRLMPLIKELRILTKDRTTERLGDVMNYAQEDFIRETERQINKQGAVRIIVLKARQLGISTIIEAIIFALSLMYKDFQSLIISHESESAQHILGMTKRYWTTYPWQDMHTEQYNGRTQLAWSDLRSNIVVATAKNTGAGRSKTLHALHASEVAFWDNPEELVTGLRQAIPSQGITIIFYESTANGVGNFFHRQWEEAERGRSEFSPKFYPWHLHPEYTAQNIPMLQKDKYAILGELDDEERKLLSMGVSEGRLMWRRYAIQNLCDGNLDKFHQEYPTTPNEAFLSTGRNVFSVNDLNAHFQEMRPARGVLVRGAGGKIEFVKDPDGPLKVYRFPTADQSWGIYQIGGDPTHAVAGDRSCAQVISRRTLEQCAVLSSHMDAVELGKQMELLGLWYNTATLAPEKEGGGGATVGYLLGVNYPNVWEAQKFEKTPGKVTGDTFGWGTNKQTKATAIQWLVHALGQPLQRVGSNTYGLLLHDKDTYDELKDYVSDGKGGYVNGEGSLFDDMVMALAITLATHYLDPPVPPYEREVNEIAQSALKVVRTELDNQHREEMGIRPTETDMDSQGEEPPWSDWSE